MSKLVKMFAAAAAIAVIGMLSVLPSTPASAQSSDQVFRWRYAIYFPSMTSLAGRHATMFAKAVYERTKGRLLIDVFPGGMLGYPAYFHHRVVRDGLLEMGTTMSAAMIEAPEWETLSHVLLFRTREDAVKAWEIALPELDRAALDTFNVKLLGTLIPEFDYMFSKAPMPTVADWKGRKFRAWHKQLACWFEQMGATPMVIPFHEAYTALSTGQVEGNSGMFKAALDLKFHEVMKFVSTGWKPNMPFFVTVVNKDAWNKLPADLKKILTEEGDKYFNTTSMDYWNAWPQSLKKLVKLGVTKVDVSPAELKKGRDLAQKCWNKWMDETTPEAAALMKRIMAALK
ncbi:MAG: TRAP transporter substrate-binding protein DctP [Rhodospirillales bacterium]|nr:TRAP transporter substrate-binding protein DctP [Rhodospirillales bacterium]